jgi:hypothetical protein
MSSVLAGLHARRAALKKAIKQALDGPSNASPPNDDAEPDDPLWELQRNLESLHAQISAYERQGAPSSSAALADRLAERLQDDRNSRRTSE